MRTESLLLACAFALAGCASAPRAGSALTSERPPCASGAADSARADLCTYPADVRAFVEDRDLCDHFRGEPWPEGDSDAERARRRELAEGIRTACAGTDRRLSELKARYLADPRIATLLGRFAPANED